MDNKNYLGPIDTDGANNPENNVIADETNSVINEDTMSFEPAIQAAEPIPHPVNATPVKKANHKPKRSFSFATLIACMIICALLSTVISAAVTMAALGGKDPQNNLTISNGTNQTNTNTNTTITNTTDNYVEAVAQKVRPSVVAVVCSYSYSNGFFGNTSVADSEGSGVIYSKDGYIITNKHVIDYAIGRSNTKVSVYLHNNPDKEYVATIVGYDASIDLAVLKINATDLPAAEFGDSSNLKVGQNAVAVGNPGGLEFAGSVSVGYISGLNRKVSIDSTVMSLIQTDSAINPGNSGGALVDKEGKLIGITNAKLVSEEFEGMGFAIPINKAVEICDNIIAGKDSPKPYIGVNINTAMTADRLNQMDLPQGAYVASVVTGGPADKAGIKANDIIVSIASKNIKNYEQIGSVIKDLKVGEKVSVIVYRNGKYLNLSLTIGTNG